MRNFENVDLSVLSKELRKIFRLKIFFFFFFRDGGGGWYKNFIFFIRVEKKVESIKDFRDFAFCMNIKNVSFFLFFEC